MFQNFCIFIDFNRYGEGIGKHGSNLTLSTRHIHLCHLNATRLPLMGFRGAKKGGISNQNIDEKRRTTASF